MLRNDANPSCSITRVHNKDTCYEEQLPFVDPMHFKWKNVITYIQFSQKQFDLSTSNFLIIIIENYSCPNNFMYSQEEEEEEEGVSMI